MSPRTALSASQKRSRITGSVAVRLAARRRRRRFQGSGTGHSSPRCNLAQIAMLDAQIGNHPYCCDRLSAVSVELTRRLADERQIAIQPTISNGSSGGATTGFAS